MNCPSSSFFVQIDGRAGEWMDALGAFHCSDGSVLGAVGGPGGAAVTNPACPSGYSAITLTHAVDIDAVVGIKLMCGTREDVIMGYGQAGAVETLTCPPGTVLQGAWGAYGQVVESVHFQCELPCRVLRVVRWPAAACTSLSLNLGSVSDEEARGRHTQLRGVLGWIVLEHDRS